MSHLHDTLTNITPPRVPLTDARTGLISREWYRFFLNLFMLTGGGQNATSISDLQVGPPVHDFTGEFSNISNQLQSLQITPPHELSDISRELQSLQITPPVELGTFASLQQSSLPWVTFSTSPQNVPSSNPGTLYWDSADGIQTLALTMAGGTVTQLVGEEQFYRIKASSTVTAGQVIMFDGTVGASGALKGKPATGMTAATALYTMGVAAENISTNGWGYVTSFGLVRGIDTTGTSVGEVWVDGDILYLNPSVVGGLTKNVPTSPNPKVVVASVVHAAANGSLFVRLSFGGRLGDFEGDVSVSAPANGHLLIYDAVQGRWENATLTAGTNVTITNGAGSVTINSTNPGGTVTSVGLGMPSQFSVSNSPVTTSGTLTASWVNQTANTVLAGPATGAAAAPTFRALVAADIPSAALTRTNDTNVTLTLGGSPTTSLLAATSLTLGWTGQLATSRGGTGLSSFTSGSILYASSTSALGNSNLYSNGTNIGLNNSTPLTWSSGNALTIGTTSAFANDSTYGSIVSNNVYYNAGWKIATTGSVAGGLLAVGNYGRMYFFGTSSGTAGNAATLTQYLLIDGNSSGATTFGPTSGGAQDMNVSISNTNFYSYLNFQHNGTTFASILGYYGNGLYYNADYHYIRTAAGTTLLTVDTNGNIYGKSGTTGMTDGFFYIPSAAGTPTGVPTSVSGHVPMYYDTTNNKFYVYNGAWKSVTLA